MIVLVFDDEYYSLSVKWLRRLADTLSIDKGRELHNFVDEMSANICASAAVFYGVAFENFILELDNHPDPQRLKMLLDKARVKGGDQTPF